MAWVVIVNAVLVGLAWWLMVVVVVVTSLMMLVVVVMVDEVWFTELASSSLVVGQISMLYYLNH